MSYEPGQYQKGEVVKTARSRREAVALSFEGYQPVKDDAPAQEQESPAPTVSEDAPVLDETNDDEPLVVGTYTFDDED